MSRLAYTLASKLGDCYQLSGYTVLEIILKEEAKKRGMTIQQWMDWNRIVDDIRD